MAAKQDTKQEKKKVNPVWEYFTRLNGQVIINDPTLLL